VLIEFDPVKDAKNRASHDGISLGEYAYRWVRLRDASTSRSSRIAAP
jgi:hypothetical protein